MSRHFLSKRDIKAMREDLNSIPAEFSELDRLEIEEQGKLTLYYYRRKPFFYRNEGLIPTLFMINTQKPSKNRVTVDRGAVPHVAKGAGVFIRGIIEADQGITEGDMVFVRNEDGVYIAVGFADTDTDGLLSKRDGEGIRTVHFLEDEIMREYTS